MRKEIEQLIGYAVKEGYISDVEDWTDKQKEDYYNKCMALDPGEDFIKRI